MRLTTLFSAFFCLITLLICSPALALENVTMQLKWLHHFQFAGYYAALEKGFYQQAGLNVTLREGGPDVEVEQEVLTGRADFGVGTSALLLNRAKGENLVVVGQLFQHSPAIFLTPRKTGIRSVADLAGKRCMYSNQHGDMLALLKLNKVDANSLIKVPHQGDPRDLLTGKADVMMAYNFNEPYALEETGEPYLTFSPLSAGIDFYGDNFFTTRQLTAKRPEMVKAFREATLKGWLYALKNKEEIVDLILAKYSRVKSHGWLMFEADQIDNLIQHNLVAIGHQNPERWEKIADTFASQGMLPKGFDYTGIIYTPKPATDYQLTIGITALGGIIITVLAVIMLSFRNLNQQLHDKIIERDRAEAERIASNERFRTLFETSPTGIILLDPTGCICLANQRMADLFGYPLEELTGISYPSLLHPAQRGAGDENMRRLMNHEIDYVDVERHYRRKDGSDFWGHLSGRRYEDADGNLINLLGQIADITERKTDEAAQKQLELQMLQTQKLESLGVLAGGIAHDFNNILMAIMGNAELALMRLNPESPVIDNLQRIEKSAARAADLARQMLAYSGKGKFQVVALSLNRLVEEMLHLLEVSISKKAMLRLNLAKNLPLVNADATQMRQIIMNLVINASEAIGDKSGVIAVTTGYMECDSNYLKDVWMNENLSDGRFIFLEISDTGCGMNKETMAKLFDPFFTTKFTGRGLGMSAVLGIVRGHHGAIKVYSEPEKGTTFKIFLPASDITAEPFNGHNHPDHWQGSGTVLLVDDEETVRGIGTEMLRELGFEVITAVNGNDALIRFREHPDISFVLLDLTMPKMDGEQCYRELRSIKPDVKVIISSGYSEQEVGEKFLGKGLAGFIQKPYRLSVLKDVIRNLNGAAV